MHGGFICSVCSHLRSQSRHIWAVALIQWTFNCLMSTMETLGQICQICSDLTILEVTDSKLTDFSHCSGVSVVDFEKVNADCVYSLIQSMSAIKLTR